MATQRVEVIPPLFGTTRKYAGEGRLVAKDSIVSTEGNSGDDFDSSLGPHLISLACYGLSVSDSGSGRFVLTMTVSGRWSLVVDFGQPPISGCTIPIAGLTSSPPGLEGLSGTSVLEADIESEFGPEDLAGLSGTSLLFTPEPDIKMIEVRRSWGRLL
jgi:hypothetical protein